MKKTVKPLFMGIIILFLIVFMNRNNYYENKTVLSETSIKQFEKDLQKGKTINPTNYLTKEKDYNNKATKGALEISKIIEKIVNKSLNKLFNYLR